MIKPDNLAAPFAKPISSDNSRIKEQHYSVFIESILSAVVSNASASDLVGIPTQISGDQVTLQAPGRAAPKERGTLNFFSLIWTSSFLTTVSFAKDGIKDKFRYRFRKAYIYYSLTFAGITSLGFLEAIIVKVIDARFFGG